MLDLNLIHAGLTNVQSVTGTLASSRLSIQTSGKFVATANAAADQLRTLATHIDDNEDLAQLIRLVAEEASVGAMAAGYRGTRPTLAHPIAGEVVPTRRRTAERALAQAHAHVGDMVRALDASRAAMRRAEQATAVPGINGHAEALALFDAAQIPARTSESIERETFEITTRHFASPHRDAILGELMAANSELRTATTRITQRAADVLEHPGTVYDLDSLLEVGQRELHSAQTEASITDMLQKSEDYIASVSTMSNRDLAIGGPEIAGTLRQLARDLDASA